MYRNENISHHFNKTSFFPFLFILFFGIITASAQNISEEKENVSQGITARDNCAATSVITQNPAVGIVFSNGTIVVLTETDAADNFSNCSFTINTSADIIIPTITCPGNQTLAIGDAVPDYSGIVIVSDNCDYNPW
ncbi:hypothetical protein AB9T88_07840 [Flavobacterium sp. LBUM151]